MIIRRYDFLARTDSATVGPINAGLSGTGGRIRAVWIDPSSQMDQVIVVSPSLGLFVEDGASGALNLSGVSAAGGGVVTGSAQEAPWDWQLTGTAAQGQGCLVAVGAPLICDIDSFMHVRVGRRGTGYSTSNFNSAPARVAFNVAFDEVPSSFPTLRAKLVAGVSGNPTTTGRMILGVPTYGRRLFRLQAFNNDGANALNLAVALLRFAPGPFVAEGGGGTWTRRTSGGLLVAAAANGNFEAKDVFPVSDNAIGEWMEVIATGPSTNAIVGLTVED